MPATTIDLHVSDADRILAHLLRLSAEDRSMRFSARMVTDDTFCQDVKRIRFGRGLVQGQMGKLGQCVGLGHGGARRLASVGAVMANDHSRTQE